MSIKCIKTGGQLYDRDSKTFYYGDLFLIDSMVLMNSVNSSERPLAEQVHAISFGLNHKWGSGSVIIFDVLQGIFNWSEEFPLTLDAIKSED